VGGGEGMHIPSPPALRQIAIEFSRFPRRTGQAENPARDCYQTATDRQTTRLLSLLTLTL
jgi:hypothetical protein